MAQKRTFDEWKKIVDNHLLEMCSMTSDCLPDINYRDLYDMGKAPGTAARAAIKYAKEN